MPKSNQIQHLQKPKHAFLIYFSSLWIKPSSSLSMAPNQNTTKPKTNHFLSCFGFSSNSMKKKPKKSDTGTGRKKLFKLNWPKLKVIVIDPKTAALKASHDIMLQATKVHNLKLIDHKINKSLEPNVLPKGINHHQDNESHPKIQSYCATCHNKKPSTPKPVKCSILSDKVSKDSLIGVLIMVLMLIIMSIWGRLCAILCMSAWLYCIPLFRGTANRVVIPNHTDSKSGMDYLNTELYNKKVVLQGFLQRDHKTSIAIS